MPFHRRWFWILLALAAPLSMVEAAEKLPFQEAILKRGTQVCPSSARAERGGHAGGNGAQEAALTGSLVKVLARIPSS